MIYTNECLIMCQEGSIALVFQHLRWCLFSYIGFYACKRKYKYYLKFIMII